MRRILPLVALVASLLAAVPVNATEAAQTRAAAVGQVNVMAAAGFTMAWHTDGRVEGHKGWYNPDNGRIYRFLFVIDVDHDTPAVKWRPAFHAWCTRTYGNLTVDNKCNFRGEFKAVVSPNGSSVSSVGSRPLDDIGGSNLCTEGLTDFGQDRAYGSSYPWFMSFVEDFQVDFLTTACGDIHTTLEYDIGSKLVNGQTEAEITHNLTGIAG